MRGRRFRGRGRVVRRGRGVRRFGRKFGRRRGRSGVRRLVIGQRF